MNKKTDSELFLALKNGDASAINSIFETYFPKLMRVAYSLTHDRETSEELCQDVFVYLWKSREKLEIKTALKPYLFQAIKYRCYSHFRRANNTTIEPVNELTLHSETDLNADQGMQTLELHQIIEQAIASLPTKTRSVFVLSREEEMSYKDIAANLNISVKTVEYHMGNALRQLKSIIETTGYVLWWIYVLLIN